MYDLLGDLGIFDNFPTIVQFGFRGLFSFVGAIVQFFCGRKNAIDSKKRKKKIFFCRIMDEIETANYLYMKRERKRVHAQAYTCNGKEKTEKQKEKKQKKQKKCRLVLVFWKLFV